MEGTSGPEAAGRLAADLVAAYTAQLGAYREWLSLARQAQEHLRGDDLDEFLRVHARKEAVASRLQSMDERIQACRRGLAYFVGVDEPTLSHLQKAVVQLPDPAYVAAVADLPVLLDQLRAVMQELQAVEEATEHLLRERLLSLRADISQTQAARRAARAYHGPAPAGDGEPRFIDHKG
ncbi:MAG TPA: flagellar export chaperone FlgN [Limnochordales bacterium]